MPRRVDANQNDIVKAFRAFGANVLILSDVGKGCPDLLVSIRGHLHLIEVKDGKKPLSQQKLTEHEQKFFDTWKGNVRIVRSLDDVINLLKFNNT